MKFSSKTSSSSSSHSSLWSWCWRDACALSLSLASAAEAAWPACLQDDLPPLAVDIGSFAEKRAEALMIEWIKIAFSSIPCFVSDLQHSQHSAQSGGWTLVCTRHVAQIPLDLCCRTPSLRPGLQQVLSKKSRERPASSLSARLVCRKLARNLTQTFFCNPTQHKKTDEKTTCGSLLDTFGTWCLCVCFA